MFCCEAARATKKYAALLHHNRQVVVHKSTTGGLPPAAISCSPAACCLLPPAAQHPKSTFIMFCWPKASSTLQATSGGTPLVVLLHWRSQCSSCNKKEEALHHNRRLWCSTQYAAGGTPAAYCGVQQVVHLLDYCCIGVANAAFHCEFQCS